MMNEPDKIIHDLVCALKLGDAPIGEHWGCILTKQQVKDTLNLIVKYRDEIDRLQEIINNIKEVVGNEN